MMKSMHSKIEAVVFNRNLWITFSLNYSVKILLQLELAHEKDNCDYSIVFQRTNEDV